MSTPEAKAGLTASVNAGLAALSQIDLVLAATENCEARPSAAIWQALGRRDASVQQALALAHADVESMSRQRTTLMDFGRVAPLSVAFFGTVPDLRDGYTGVLLEVRWHPHLGSRKISSAARGLDPA